MANFQPYFLANSTFDQLPKSIGSFLAVDQKFKITQNDINKTFDHLKTLKKFDQVMKYYKLIIKNFDQVKKHNFDQLKFDQVIVSRYTQIYRAE